MGRGHHLPKGPNQTSSLLEAFDASILAPLVFDTARSYSYNLLE